MMEKSEIDPKSFAFASNDKILCDIDDYKLIDS